MIDLTSLPLSSTRILVAGDVMLDRYWFGDVKRISPEAPVPVLQVKKYEDRLGGAANVARNITALSAQASLLGAIGADEAGDAIKRLLKEANINNYLQCDDAVSTIVKLRAIGQQQHLLRIDFEDQPTDATLDNGLEQFKQAITTHDAIILSDYAKGALSKVRDMIALARAADKKTFVDPKGDDFTKYTGAFLLTPNKAEFEHIAGKWHNEDDLTHKAQRCREDLQLEALLLTRSEEGMTLYTKDDVTYVPTTAREVFDVSGAGDTVIATLATLIGAGMSLKEAVWYANHAAGIVVGKLGAATVSIEELNHNEQTTPML